ncbi:polysaccharide deacetylase family protein [Solibacillus sp. MA9]|uniref:Polysaccharide deacetylase family protein n=1 Tax=Solibacillus palustris TaxID=2908203 RepID=A0ABS9UEN6_9BACL|nr:polysaccharide deacetylase family protein [Solibacillus sp. MA9]MCH7322801.1 polysaccharide deacetylase family protein [Solibacillus sp. MA9]
MKKLIFCAVIMVLFSLYLSLYSSAATNANIKMTTNKSELFDDSLQLVMHELPQNVPVIVLEEQEQWSKVQYKEQIGYINNELLTTVQAKYMLVHSKADWPIYLSDAQQGQLLGRIYLNSIVEVFPSNSPNYIFIRYGHLAGYVDKQAVVDPSTKKKIVNDPKGLIVRTTASLSSDILGHLSANTEVTMLTNFNGWAFVTTKEVSGYVLASSLKNATTKPLPPNNTTSNKTKKIALTFDDGPHPKVTLQILEILERYNAKATFFVVGNEVKKNPKILKSVADAGHEIGNHTYNHTKLTTLPLQKAKLQIDSTDAVIKATIGHNATVFRPPYGAYDKTIINQLKVPNILWTIDTLDWKHRDPKKTLAAVQKNARNGSIILMHDIHQTTADALDPILATLQEQGYEFVTVSEIIKK